VHGKLLTKKHAENFSKHTYNKTESENDSYYCKN